MKLLLVVVVAAASLVPVAAAQTVAGDSWRPPKPPYNLVAKTQQDGSVLLTWDGGRTTYVQVFRDGQSIRLALDNGSATDSTVPGPGSYSYQVCETGADDIHPPPDMQCSNVATTGAGGSSST